MKKYMLASLAILAGFAASAQGFTDAYNLSQTELRGSARFMGMGGAFTALGADLSALNQNPAGIGMYRGSDIGLTLGVDINTNESSGDGLTDTNTFTRANLNSAGYVGTMIFGDNRDCSVSWGFSYNRLMRFDRQYNGAMSNMQTSLSNYVASFTNGVDPSKLWMSDSEGRELYPYDNWSANAPDWMSVLFYNSGMINSVPTTTSDGQVVETDVYAGLWEHGYSSGIADYSIREKGHADEYNFTIGGMIMNVVSWGIGVGITDLDFTREYWYGEQIDDANVPAYPLGFTSGTANRADLIAYQKVSGTGANFKFGAIIKPVQQFRIGLAVHTPTYYSFDVSSYGDTDFRFSIPNDPTYKFEGTEGTPWDDYSYRLHTPWKLMAGVAFVIGPKAILSADYEYDAYSDMKQKDNDGFDFTGNNDRISRFYRGTSNFRIGLEYRFTPQLSGRLGFNTQASAAGKELKDSNTDGSLTYVSTAGQDPSYEVHNSNTYITAGLGYRVNGFYFDLAYVHKHTTSELNAFTPFTDYDGGWSMAPSAKLTGNMSQIVATLGYRF